MARILILLLAFLLGLGIVALAASPALPPQRDDCRLIFLKVPLDDPDLAEFDAFLPTYLCRKRDA